MAVMPVVPLEHNTAIPEPLSDIIMKLLNKNAEDRYRSAFGLRHDLDNCLTEFKYSGSVKRFPLGEKDIATTLQIPEKLYGRESELYELISSFTNVSRGKTEMILVSGAAGIGKSVLINELHKPVIEQKGYFAAGKFEQFKHGIPYSAVRQAFQELSRQLLSERADKIAEWRKDILAALGSNGQVIVDIIPEMELIIGSQPPVEPLPPTQSQNRFNMVFTEFVKVFANQMHPLVLFLDDVQWADPATLKLVEMLAISPETKALLIIGAYRDKEVGPAHPLVMTIDEIFKTGVTVKELHLKPLPVGGTIKLITDTLACERWAAKALASVVMDKTHGNPFFINHFLKNLYQTKMIRFDTDRYAWSWDTKHIQAAEITSNVVEFMCNKIQQLSQSAMGTLITAACIGNKFDLDLLAGVRGSTILETAAALRESQLEGLIVPIGVSYKYIEGYTKKELPDQFAAEDRISYMFVHDRIQQAAYSLIPDDTKNALHHGVGKMGCSR
jgi:predicted ATPase